MPHYLIEISHEDDHEACVRALRTLQDFGSHLVTNAQWGCLHDVHSGWLIADLPNAAEAERIVPPQFRGEARIVELNRFTSEDITRHMAELEQRATS